MIWVYGHLPIHFTELKSLDLTHNGVGIGTVSIVSAAEELEFRDAVVALDTALKGATANDLRASWWPAFGEVVIESLSAKTWEIADWPADKRQRARHWVGVYKRHRHLLGREYYRLLPQPESEADWNAFQFCDGPEEGLVFVFRVAGETDTQRLTLRGLDGAKSYRFTDEGAGTTTRHAGGDLAQHGLTASLAPNDAKLFSYRAE